MTQTLHGSMATERPERYAKQLAQHWSRKGSAAIEDGTTVIRFDSGQVVRLLPRPATLDIRVEVPDGVDADRFAQVVGEHLERFGQRDELHVAWD